MSFDLNQTNNNNSDNYIQKIQSEIDSLEKQLFSKEKSYLKSTNNNNTKKNKPLHINKDLSVPIETTISNINDDTILTQQTILNNNMSPSEKAELYKIIMRERNENAELEKLNLEKIESYKPSKYKKGGNKEIEEKKKLNEKIQNNQEYNKIVDNKNNNQYDKDNYERKLDKFEFFNDNDNNKLINKDKNFKINENIDDIKINNVTLDKILNNKIVFKKKPRKNNSN